MDTKSSKCVHLVEGGTNGSQDVNMAPMGKTSLGRVIHARKRQKTSFTNLETHGDGSGYLACDTCSSGVPNEIVPAGIVPIGNIPVGNNIGFQTRTKGSVSHRNLAWRPIPQPRHTGSPQGRGRKQHKGKEKVVRARGKRPHRARTVWCTARAPFSHNSACFYCSSSDFRFLSILLTYMIAKWRNVSLLILRRPCVRMCPNKLKALST